MPLPDNRPATNRTPKNILWVRVGGCLPLNSGGRIRSYHTLTHMLAHCRVHALELHRHGDAPGDDSAPYAQVIEKVWFDGLPAWSRRRFHRFAWPLLKNVVASSEPFALERYRSAAFSKRVRELALSGQYDLIVCDGLAAASAFEGWKQENHAPTVLFQHNVEALIWERLATVQRHLSMRLFFQILARRMSHREPELCRIFDGVITISEEDASYHRDSYGLGNVLGCVPAGANVDARGVPESVLTPPAGPCLAFLGSMDWLPNQDAVTWFIDEIFPKVRRTVPDVKLVVIGRNPPASLLQLTGDDRSIQFTGTVEDVVLPLRECTLMVVPLRAGSGTRIKILESMAAGVPVVSTTVGVEGLPLRSNEDLLVADDVPGITNAILRLLNDNALRQALAENGMQRVVCDFSWQHSAECFFRLTEALDHRPHEAKHGEQR
jgi:glycosyltransferase involved in cell wall biosynthesis